MQDSNNDPRQLTDAELAARINPESVGWLRLMLRIIFHGRAVTEVTDEMSRRFDAAKTQNARAVNCLLMQITRGRPNGEGNGEREGDSAD